MSSNKSINYDKSLSTDIAIFTIHEDKLKILLVKRAHEPFKEVWALPGVFRIIDKDETLEDIANRGLIEETGTKAPYLEQLYTFGSATRDPRRWVTSVAYYAFMPYESIRPFSGKRVSLMKLMTIHNNKLNTKLAFDHSDIVNKAIERIRAKATYSGVAAYLLQKEFSLPELHKVYELLMGCVLDRSYFRTAAIKSGILIETNKQSESKGGRRAILYKFKKGAEYMEFFPRGIMRINKDK